MLDSVYCLCYTLFCINEGFGSAKFKMIGDTQNGENQDYRNKRPC